MNEKKLEAVVDSGEIPEVVVEKKQRISLVWFIPLIAAGIGVWLVYQALAQSGIPISITFMDGSNVDAKTLIKFEGVTVGTVKSVSLRKDLNGVIVRAVLDRSAEKLARKGAKFWVVRPRISAGGITGLETLVTGSYIGVLPGNGPSIRVFQGLESAPPGRMDGSGLHLVLQAEQLGSLHPGAPVYYREVKVGEVEQCELAGNARAVNVHIVLEEKFTPLVRENSRFWNASGIGMSLSLFGAKVRTESLAAVLTGGVAFATPDNAGMGGPVKEGAVFQLADKPEKDWLAWKPEIALEGNAQPAVEGKPAAHTAGEITPDHRHHH